MIERLRRALVDLLNRHRLDNALPTNIRFLFYELEMLGLAFKKKLRGAKRGSMPDTDDVSDALTDLREKGGVPWEWIVDETRFVSDYTGWADLSAGAVAAIESLRLDPWEKWPLILTESRSLAGTLRPLADEYRVLLAATNGACTGFFHTKLEPYLEDIIQVLSLDDHDLAGDDIEARSRRTIEKLVREYDPEFALGWERIAVTEAQIALYGLTPIEKTDARYKGGRKFQAVETEALSQKLILSLVREALDVILPEPLDAIVAREEAQREILKTKIQN
jgi:hypothetical protein